ncbi:MAG: hypothetical protein KME20_03105 [Kaiparowitsia implicata GSE-PSE-MK54-09C]|jgi:hypothetical protein|nr:hypothetical protein [Kaiparowitsia implicata GSE-PSE-MK54-09C]
MSELRKLRVISLNPNVVVLHKAELIHSDDITEEVIIAPFLLDEDKVIDDISELVGTVYEKFSEACGKRNLNWEAELELGLEFGVKFSARLKISPTKPHDA